MGSLFKKPAGAWDCGTCLIQNKPDVEKCAACENPRPKSKTTVSTSKVRISLFSAVNYVCGVQIDSELRKVY